MNWTTGVTTGSEMAADWNALQTYLSYRVPVTDQDKRVDNRVLI